MCFSHFHSNNSPNRDWLLDVIRDTAAFSGPLLEFFVQYVMPESQRVLACMRQATADGHAVAAKNLHNLFCRLWSLFPTFAITPIDLVEVSVCDRTGLYFFLVRLSS